MRLTAWALVTVIMGYLTQLFLLPRIGLHALGIWDYLQFEVLALAALICRYYVAALFLRDRGDD